MQRRIEQLGQTVARLETHARSADGAVALLVGILAGAGGLDLAREIGKEHMPGASHEGLGHLPERFEMGRSANQA